MVREAVLVAAAAALAPEGALELVAVLAAVADRVEAAEALVVEQGQGLEAARAAVVELAVAALGQEVGQELELVAAAKHLESGSLRRHCFEAAVLAVVAPWPAEWAAGRAPVAPGLA
jgi:hypothetical protein